MVTDNPIKKIEDKIGYEQLRRGTDYLKLPNVKGLLSDVPPAGVQTFFSIFQAPYLAPEGRSGYYRKPLVSRLKALEEVPNAYFGIGGDLEQYRNLLIMIAIRKYQQSAESLSGRKPTAIIYDAYPYDFLNQLDIKLSEKPAGILSKMLELSDVGKEERRKTVFQVMAKQAGAEVLMLTARELFVLDSYVDELSGLLERLPENRKEWQTAVPLKYRASDPSLLYVPLEIAEALALKQTSDVRLKIGGQKEKVFDRLIARADVSFIFAYSQDAITPSVGSVAPYRNREDITFDMDIDQARAFLQKTRPETMWQFSRIAKELGYVDEAVDATLDIFSKIMREIG
ncbi:MAG: hypothetical protein HYX24_04240 [Candidatus Aenigmarchaeota archaeon]|nr:hypothetical protein [Candidatus Aenigmarchaeota archaeon]